MNFSTWLNIQNETVNKGNMLPPELDAQMAVNFLRDYLLGEDWYTVNPINNLQANTEIVFDILKKYSRRFKKELKAYRRHLND